MHCRGKVITHRIALSMDGSALEELSNDRITYRNCTVSDFVELEGVNKLVHSRVVLQIALVSQLRFNSDWRRTGVEITTGIPPAEEHQLKFDVTVTDAARIVQCQTFPSGPDVRNDRGAIVAKPCAYIMRIDDKNDDVYAAAISFPS